MSKNSISFSDGDFCPLAEFGLRWRWLEPNQYPMSENELARIKPLAPSAAKRAWEFSLPLHSRDAFDARPSSEWFSSVSSLENPHENGGVQWLSGRLPDSAVPVIVSWQPGDAVLTDSALFAERWEAFCYPASDDVSIWPMDSSWAVTYWHEEQLWFGER